MKRGTTLRLDDLAIGYATGRSTRAVACGLSAEVRGGELTCLLGPNGAGKSTLLRTLSGFLPPLGGEVRLLGRRLDGYAAGELARTLGVVLTDRCEIMNMTVEELAGMGRAPYTGFWGRLGREDRRVVDEAIAQVGIEALRGRMVHTLSDGERQKVMIAKALAQQTPVILLDEPTAFLDYPSKVEIMQLLHRLTRETGKTIFLSTHDLELALQLADRLWLMKRGEGLAVGAPEDLALDGRMERFFARGGILFDPMSGLFRIAGGGMRPVRLEGGGGVRRAMLVKGLRRCGFDPERGDGPRVEVGDAEFVVRCGGRTERCGTVARVVELLEE